MKDKDIIMQNKTYHIITIGCQMNKNDSERIASYMNNLGFSQSDDKYQADLVFIVTCGVRQSAEDRIYGLIPGIQKKNPKVKIVLTGCLSDRVDVRKRLEDKVDIWMNISDLPKLSEIIGLDKIEDCPHDYLEIAPERDSKFSAFVPIGNGCNNFCTYCVVPYARGREVYRDAENILQEVRDLVQARYKEVILIAQNVNSYKSGDMDFPDLLRAVNDIEGDFWIRFATSHPKDMSDKLIEVLGSCKKICEHVHLPAQAGNNEILAAMNRKYTVEHYKGLIDKIKKAVPGVFISTDIIVGFPGETEEQFQDTADLFEYAGYDMAYVAQYSPRFGTASYSLDDDVSLDEKKRREEYLMNILRKTALINSETYLDKKVAVLIEGQNKKGEWYGKTRTSKSVKADYEGEEDLTGKVVNVFIDGVEDFGIQGKIES